ncbi:MAG: mannitol dehydrogenase family protein [Rhodospirillaceae bacterium]|nr:mannitol dehydrogenase family protein [Rhodospirillaceae bacterium]
MAATPILQFGTSRFLQAHVDLFVSEGLKTGSALGPITVVRTTTSPESAKRIAAFDRLRSYPVHIRGLAGGAVVDACVEVSSVARGLDANTQWEAVEEVFVREAECVVSNTGERGYELHDGDGPDGPVPRSFPAKLARLLHARYRHDRRPLALFPTELVTGNGAVLRDTVLAVARGWRLEPGFLEWLATSCRWPSSLVDRIVSEALNPIGAVAEPYALWAVEAVPEAPPPCRHPAIVVTDDLARYERLKLFILNLGHSFLAERWLIDRRPAEETVREALGDERLRADLDFLYEEEVLPVFDAIGLGPAARDYRRVVIERFLNPFLRHRLADIAGNHEAKKQRRFRPVFELARRHCPGLRQPRLQAALASGAGAG